MTTNIYSSIFSQPNLAPTIVSIVSRLVRKLRKLAVKVFRPLVS